MVHSLDIHFVEERNSYCRLNDDGDLEDIISVYEEKGADWSERVTIVTVRAKEFSEYMRLSEMGAVVFFDFTRLRHGSFNGWSGQKSFDQKARDLFYHGGLMPGHASYVNGRLIARPAVTYEEIVKARQEARNPSNRQYASFKIINLKTAERIEITCDPKGLSNYFQPDLPLPLEMSPAFFRAEVLQRYKANPDKYELTDRSIYCRGTWSLKTYDINDAEQVHTYLRYLSDLPYKEQLYWQSFNEWPKAPLSERAITTDFKGEFYLGHDPLNTLKYKLQGLDRKPPAWWQRRGDEVTNAVHYPVTSSSAEWANEILALDQLVVEGFHVKGLRSLAKKLGRAPEPEWQSLKLLEECLIGVGLDADEAKVAINSLRTLRELRNIVKGHAAVSQKREREKQILKSSGTFRSHFTSLAADCNSTIAVIMKNLGKD